MKRLTKLVSVMMAVVMILGILPQFVVSAAYENTHVNTGNQAYDIVEVAKTQIGYTEGSNNDTKYNRWFGRLTGFPSDGYGYAWCQTFVAWCANQAGISTSDIPRVSGTISAKQTFINNGTYHTGPYEGGSYTPKKGDIIYFYSSATDSKHHVGIVSDCVGGIVYTIEGNSSNKVQTCSYSVTNSKIRGYGVPNYSGTVTIVTEAPIVTTAHKYYVPNAEISVNWTTSAGATGYWLDTYKNGEHILTQNLGNVNTYTTVYDEGIYEVLITAYSENGGWSAVTSESCLFIVEEVTAPTVSTAAKYYVPNAEISVNWSVVESATGYWLDIYKNGEHILTQNLGNVNTYTSVYDEGIYEVLITAYSENGGWSAATSENCLFFVEEVTAPTVSTAAKYHVQNTDISVNWSSSAGATGYWFDLYKNEEHILSTDRDYTTSYTLQYDAGIYDVFVTAYNENGGWSAATSDVYRFYVYTPADLNSDSSVTITDLTLLQQYILNLTPFTEAQFTTADLNSDGSVNAFDLALLKQLLLDN